ncbi:MAG: hypothetical protein Q9212_001403 [Teloschistes hypoglaucus]
MQIGAALSRTTISDLVQISPEDLQKPSAESIEDNINAKYANKVGAQTILELIFSSKCDFVKVVQKIGLCICVYDILTASDGLIGHGTGIVNVNVEFRLIVFRPFKGEIIAGRISGASAEGMRSSLTLDFFDDIFVPANLLFADSTFNDLEQCWIWSNEGQEYFYDKTEWVRFRVEQEHWTDLAPVAPSERDSAAMAERKSPYSITPQWNAEDYQSEGYQSDDKIKWRYELVFDHDGKGILCEQKDSSSSMLEDVTDPEDARYSSQGNYIEEPSSVESWATVEAHWRFFKTMYHNPIDIRVDDDPPAALQRLSELVAVGELYGGLKSLASTIEAFIARHMGSFLAHLYSQGPLILSMARSLKIGWLFKDMVCLAVGDTTRTYDQLCRDYQTTAASIIFEKREKLQKRIRDVNFRLLTMQLPEGETDSSKLLVAALREMIIRTVVTTEHGLWAQYAWAYSEDPAFYSLDQVCPERDKIFKVAVVQEPGVEDAALCREMSGTVIDIISPLLVSYLSPRISFARSEDDGLTCIEATDDDLPWIPWRQSLESSCTMQSSEQSP